MTDLLLADSGLPLGLDFVEILLHILNFAILLVAVRYLLYKPVKKFMDNRTAMYAADKEAAEKAVAEGEKLKADYDAQLKNIEQKADENIAAAKLKAEAEADKILKDANEKAERIIGDATKKAELDKKKMLRENAEEVVSLSTQMAGQLIKKQLSAKEDEELIEECLKKWCNDENGNS